MVYYARKHWRGELSLGLSFWGNLVLPYASLWLLLELWLPLDLDVDSLALALRPDIAALLFVGSVAAVFSVLIWQVVGVIRSAQVHKKRTGRKRAAFASQGVAVVFLVLHLPILWFIPYRYLFGMAMMATGIAANQFDQAEISLCSTNTAIKVEGAFGLGLSAEIRRQLSRYPDIQLIVLQGPGGSAYEARALHRIIASHSLTTIALDSCSSACAVAFLGGKKRIIGENARLGLHAVGQYSWDTEGVDLGPQNRAIKSLFVKQGISPGFINTVFSTPPDSTWYPSFQDLQDSVFIHGFIDSSLQSELLSESCSEIP